MRKGREAEYGPLTSFPEGSIPVRGAEKVIWNYDFPDLRPPDTTQTIGAARTAGDALRGMRLDFMEMVDALGKMHISDGRADRKN